MRFKTYIELADGCKIDRSILPLLRKGIRYIFDSHDVEYTSILIVFMSDASLLQINKDYLQHDYYTDIITFSYEEEGEPVEGELLISLERVLDNAQMLHIEPSQEIMRVVFHGCLHLVGYNDATDAEKEEMRKKEKEVLAHVS